MRSGCTGCGAWYFGCPNYLYESVQWDEQDYLGVPIYHVQQELATPPRLVVRPRPVVVDRDVHVVQKDFAVLDLSEAVDERSVTGAQRLHLGPGEDEPRLVDIEDRVVVPRLLVLRDQLSTRLFCHSPVILPLNTSLVRPFSGRFAAPLRIGRPVR